MKLHLILLLLSGLSSHTLATTETMCQLLAQHRYKDIGLQSLTWDSSSDGAVLLLTAPQHRYYSLPVDKINRTSMDLSEARPLNMEEKCHYKEAYSVVSKAQATLKSTYLICLWKASFSPAFNYKHMIIMSTDKGQLRENVDGSIELDSIELPDFSLASISHAGPAINGYILYPDEPEGYIVLGGFQVSYASSKVLGLPPPKGKGATSRNRAFYYLQVSDTPHEVHLVHSQMPHDAQAQLFAPGSAVPRAFLVAKNHLALFDSEKGCVYVIADLGNFTVYDAHAHSQEQHSFHLLNIPFEEYFKCGKLLEPPDGNRCHVVKGSHSHQRPPGIDQTTENVGSFSGGQTITVFLVVVVLVGGLLYVIMTKRKAKGTKVKSAVKSSASSSAVSSTSKIGSKRSARFSSYTGKSKTSRKSTVGNSSIIGYNAKSKFTSKLAKTLKGTKTRATN